ncbi:MAG: DUF1501 domain-containing protein [Gemmataceae bacterium]
MLHRRDAMMRLGQLGLGAVTLPGLLQAERVRAGTPATRLKGKAKSCIFIFLWGGPPHQDMWDLKPDAPEGIRSQFQPIRTVVPGIDVCDQMPLFARHTDKTAIIRSMSHQSNNHEPSVYHTLTGKRNPSLVVPRNQRRRGDFPNVGAVVAQFSDAGVLPASVTVPRPIGHDGVTYAGTYAGFLGPRFDPLELKEAPNASQPSDHALTPPPDIDDTRLLARRGLLRTLEDFDRRLQNQRGPTDLSDFQEQAYRMMSSPVAKRAFQLDLEAPAVRDRYGRNEYGESFLLARRLVEAKVRLVSVNWMYFMPNGRISNVWDNHGNIGGLGGITGYAMLKEKYCIPPLDQGYSALLEDLAQRGLLDETLVVLVGEFGRTPSINQHAGRDHWGACYSAVLAGGGIRGGQVHGASDARAAYVKDNPVAPEDLLATIYAAFGLPPDTEIHDREHRPYRICDGEPLWGLLG